MTEHAAAYANANAPIGTATHPGGTADTAAAPARTHVYRDIGRIADLERAYSPSSCIDNFDALLAEYRRRSAEVREARPDMQSLAYGPHADETLDFFPATQAGDGRRRPLAVFIHGGYWQALGKRDHSFPAPGFAAQGLHYAAVNYGLAPAASMDVLIERCRGAIAWLHAHADALGVDRDAIHVSGSSAGAHLAAMAAMTDWRARGFARQPMRSLALLSGVYDLRPIPLTYINRAVGLTADRALLHSPLFRVDGGPIDLPPVLVAVGRNETTEFHRQSADFAESLQRRGLPVEHRLIEGRNHFDVVFDLGDAGTALGAAVARLMSAPTGR